MMHRGIAVRLSLIAALAAALLFLPNPVPKPPGLSAVNAVDPRPAAAVGPVADSPGTTLVPALADHPLRGAAAAAGVIIWSHGRSLTREDSAAPMPLYLASFADAGWDVLRFNRPRAIDTLGRSTEALVARIHQLHADGYRQVVLAGQSYGGFIALGAARQNPEVNAVIATAPAAYGSFFDSYDSWEKNGAALAELLRGIGQTKVVLAFFHGDDYDPGGRGAMARAVLAAEHTPFLIIDQPRDLVGHLAANTGLFVRRYGACLVAFVDAAGDGSETRCDDSWGLEPSMALLTEPRDPPGVDGVLEDGQTGASDEASDPLSGRWYGYYPNGRQFLIDVTMRPGGHVDAEYGVGPSVDGRTRSSWAARQGLFEHGELVFAEPGRSRITLAPTDLGTMQVVWRAPDGSDELEATARRIR